MEPIEHGKEIFIINMCGKLVAMHYGLHKILLGGGSVDRKEVDRIDSSTQWLRHPEAHAFCGTKLTLKTKGRTMDTKKKHVNLSLVAITMQNQQLKGKPMLEDGRHNHDLICTLLCCLYNCEFAAFQNKSDNHTCVPVGISMRLMDSDDSKSYYDNSDLRLALDLLANDVRARIGSNVAVFDDLFKSVRVCARAKGFQRLFDAKTTEQILDKMLTRFDKCSVNSYWLESTRREHVYLLWKCLAALVYQQDRTCDVSELQKLVAKSMGDLKLVCEWAHNGQCVADNLESIYETLTS